MDGRCGLQELHGPPGKFGSCSKSNLNFKWLFLDCTGADAGVQELSEGADSGQPEMVRGLLWKMEAGSRLPQCGGGPVVVSAAVAGTSLQSET